jgi:hypothetical protein
MKPLVQHFFNAPDDVCREQSEIWAQKARMNKLKRLSRRLAQGR